MPLFQRNVGPVRRRPSDLGRLKGEPSHLWYKGKRSNIIVWDLTFEIKLIHVNANYLIQFMSRKHQLPNWCFGTVPTHTMTSVL